VSSRTAATPGSHNGVVNVVERSSSARPISVAGSMSRFAAAGTLALVLLGAGAAVVLQHVTRDDAVDDARRLSVVASRSVTADVTDALLAGDPAARARLDASVHRQVLLSPVVRVKIWDGSGRIAYSDDPRLEGQSYALEGEERDVLARGGSDAEVSDLGKPENRFERPFGSLLEVYQQARTPTGVPLLFETYVEYRSIAARSQHVLRVLLPALIGALVLLQALQLPLAWRLLGRVRAGQRERELLLRRSLEASETERARIAGDLHDGVIQTLASANYQLASLSGSLGALEMPQERRLSDTAADTVRQSIRQLRSLVVDIYPPSLAEEGLGAALADLLAPLEQRAISTDLDLPERVDLPPPVEALLYRAAQEAVRNVLAHSGARRVEVAVSVARRSATLVVTDDGRGFPPGPPPGGHVGLRLLADYAAAAAATVSCGNRTDGPGAVVRVDVPVDR
jgi:signal transduction histidine kinase